MTRELRTSDETPTERKLRRYHRERLKEEASWGLDCLIRDSELDTRTAFAKHIDRSKSFVTKILDSHNFQLETLSDAYFALGYAVHLTLAPREAKGLSVPSLVIQDEPEFIVADNEFLTTSHFKMDVGVQFAHSSGPPLRVGVG